MAYTATVIPVMIASPGDVEEQRDDARDIINAWNYVNSSSSSAVLLPVRWETHSAPDLGGRPQQLINDRILGDCDLLVGIFWTRLGTPTGGFASGSAEEIQRHIDAGKPAMVYFSTAPVAPQSIDSKQFSSLTDFKGWCQSKGLIETFDSSQDFRSKFSHQLSLLIKQNDYLIDLLSSNYDQSIDNTSNDVYKTLSDEAVSLLKEGSNDANGHILKILTLGGLQIQTNGISFGEIGNPRSAALWEFAIDQLVQHGYIVDRGYKGEVFQVTSSGYVAADKI